MPGACAWNAPATWKTEYIGKLILAAAGRQ